MSVADSSANLAHKVTAQASEMTRQVAVSAAIASGGGSAAVALSIKVAEAAHYNRLAASALANGVDSAPFVQAAKWVGLHA
jgi:2-keto-3-deoxy-L-rhamnonate aldolase RhmA